MPHKFKQTLEDLTRERVAGPPPSFTLFHLLAALELIAHKPIGRNKLAETMQIGEGSIRTIISRLKDAGLIKTEKAGCLLTEKGMRVWKEYSTVFKKSEMEKNELAPAEHNFAVLIRNHGERARSGMEQRDAAIMMGAKSVTTMVLRNKRLTIPSVSSDVVNDFPDAAKQTIALLDPQENDAVVICGASDRKKAEYGALAAAWTLLDKP
jgi:predicted transcriptional regulator